MIQGICIVPGIEYAAEFGEWPTQFVEVPRTEAFVESNIGERLRVRQVVHCSKTVTSGLPGLAEEVPYIKVYLQLGVPKNGRENL